MHQRAIVWLKYLSSNRGKLTLLSKIIYNSKIFYQGLWIHRNFNQFIFFTFWRYVRSVNSSLINGMRKN